LPPLLPIYGIAAMTKPWFDDLPLGLRLDVLASGKRRSPVAGPRFWLAGIVYRVLEGCVCVSGLRAWETHISTVAF
jgi:hypothetical protein